MGLDLITVPSITRQPAIFPSFGELKISLTSASPVISSLTIGVLWPSIISEISSIVS